MNLSATPCKGKKKKIKAESEQVTDSWKLTVQKQLKKPRQTANKPKSKHYNNRDDQSYLNGVED